MTSIDILVIILSFFLAVFLVISIVVCIKIIKLLNYLNSVSKKTENIANILESISESLNKHAKSTAFLYLISNAINGFKMNKERKKNEKK